MGDSAIYITAHRLATEKCPWLVEKWEHKPGNLRYLISIDFSIWHYRPTAAPPAALKMASRTGVMIDVGESPS